MGVTQMAFSLPDFNLRCNLFDGPFLTRVLREADVPCNLAYSKRVARLDIIQDFNEASCLMSLLVPAGTDIRSLACHAATDLVECPAGTGRWYLVSSVDDIGKGFPNEHRCAVIYQVSSAMYPSGGFGTMLWPTPIP